jgi:L-ascorbate metabolism protein UlaG (beta-lactamase superfamily)
MIITYHGVEFVKIQHGDTVIAFNPPSKKSKFSGTSFGANIVLISANHPDLNGAEIASRNDKGAFVIKGPGEYEVDGMFIRGFKTSTTFGGQEKINTIYTLTVDGINVAYLGAINHSEIEPEIKEELGQADILFVPIGGDGVLDASEAYKMAVKREPSIIIPIHYGEVGDKNALKEFLKEGGQESIKPIDKLTLKKKDLEGKEGEIVVLAS